MQVDFDLATGLAEDLAATSAPAPKQRQQGQRRHKQPGKKQKKAAKQRAKGS